MSRIGARAQRGAALLTAMVIVALITTLAASMVWQQWRAIQVESAERSRTQSAWILSGALDWARLILREDNRNLNGKKGVDHLGEPWAVPLAEARLSTFLAADQATTDDAPDAFLSGSITDVQSRYNLTNLVDAAAHTYNKSELILFQRLCEQLGLSADVALRIATGMSSATPVPPPLQGASAAPQSTLDPSLTPLLPKSVQQLTWFGIDAETVRLLEPFVTILPSDVTTVNVNTAPREVIYAMVVNLDAATAERMVQMRQRTPFRDVAELQPLLPPNSASKLDVSSAYFEVRGRLRLADVVLEQRSLLYRKQGGTQVDVVHRERVASRDAFGS